jgi:hypothetical protein
MADVPRAGSFRCSNDLFNKIHDLCWWSQRSNMQSVFTDCPHREKLGWQEQNNVHSEQIRWGWQAGVMYAKTCLDLADAQLPNGMCPDIAPEYTVFRGGFRHSIEWGSSMIQIPWQQLEWTGDDALIRAYYPNMVAYHRYIRATSQRPGAAFITPGGLGDWYENTSYGRRNRRLTPIDLPATVYYFMNANILAACADRLGKAAEAAEFREEAGRIRAAFNAKWWNPATRSYAGNTQTANAMALGGGLVDPAMASSVVSNIVADIRAHGNALATGEIGYPFLLKVLSDHGYDELIYDMTCVTDKPGYGNMILKGNTTCHEAWDSRPSSSFNHFMMADIVTWFYGTLGGIKRTSHAFKTFDVAPFFPKGIDWVEARHAAPSGEIAVAWRRSGTTIAVDVTVPAGTCARVRLPGRPVETQRPGTCRYTVTVR